MSLINIVFYFNFEGNDIKCTYMLEVSMIITVILLILVMLSAAIGLVFIKLLICRQDNVPTPEKGAAVSDLFAPTGEALWAHNIPYFEPFRRLPFETAEIISKDGLILRADYLHGTPDAKVTVVFCHGYKSEPSLDFAAMYDFYRNCGYNLVYLHMRSHGKSEGRYIGFGALDRFDIPLWADKMNELFPNTSVFFHGMSMGGATVLQSANLDMPENVCGIIADCGFSSCNEVFRNLIGKMYHLPATPFVNIIELVNIMLAKYDFRSADSIKSLAQSRLPLLYICGDSDRYVPYDMAMRIFDSCIADKELLIVPNVGHAASYMYATEKYQALVTNFIDKHRRDL